MAIVSKFYDGPVTEVDWAKNRFGGPIFGVGGPDDWKVTATTGDRTVSIAPGSGFGHGIADTSDTNTTLQLDSITSGSRWDLIALRRDWQPASGGPSYFVKVTGTAARNIPAGRQTNTGVVDDQPLALVQVTAGQTQPTAIVDLRCWAGNGAIEAVDELALGYLTRTGSQVKIGSQLWCYESRLNGTFAWVPYSLGSTKVFTASSWMGGAIPISTSSNGNLVTVARIVIPDPGYPYHLSAHAIIESAQPTTGTRWDARIESPGQPRLALSRGDTAAPWYDINGVTTNPITGGTTVDLTLARLFGSASFGISAQNRIFRVMQHPA